MHEGYGSASLPAILANARIECDSEELPFHFWCWIRSGDDSAYFCSMMLLDGEPVATITGWNDAAFRSRIRSGRIIGSCEKARVRTLPVWRIEELGLCSSADGRMTCFSNLSFQPRPKFACIEYCEARILSRSEMAWRGRLERRAAGHRSPLCILRRRARVRGFTPLRERPIFAYFGHQNA
jgi:hypothetical protein